MSYTNPTIELLLKHRSIRRYTAEPIATELLELLIRCGQAAPSSSFVQAYSIIRVLDPQKRAIIAEAAGDQVWIKQAAAFLVLCADLTRVNYCGELHQEAWQGYTEHSLVATIDVALLAQNMLTAAESVGLGGVCIGGIRNNIALVSEVLDLPALVYPVFGLCLGWPDQDPAVKPRLPVSAILHDDQYDTSRLPSVIQAYDQTMQDYYAARAGNQRTSNWSTQTYQAIYGKCREHMQAFLQARGFFQR
ncbi:oxygen-insensitive NADPH nitroreductase [Thiofilum flexile]|uniref:oxygen-insensitive NADPH nitroreductase n=1 Tax=Thiofilum flexile TaxID=125627 RepID=UPI000366ACD8|nr:oxygen-insensitive NADPH nitroreductase [Thiofilum flexile]